MLNIQRSSESKMFNPLEMAREKTIAEQLHKMNVATEMLITKNVGIYYVDIMADVDTDLHASSRSILDWLNNKNHTRQGKQIKRDGLIKLYKAEYPEDFKGGKWQSYNLPNYIYFTGIMLTDKKFTNKSTSEKYKRSFIDNNWFMKFVAVIGVRMLEEQMSVDGINSKTAHEILRANKRTKESLAHISKIIGRSTKNHNVEYMRRNMKEISVGFLKDAQRSIQRELMAYSSEKHILEEFENEYLLALEGVRRKLITN